MSQVTFTREELCFKLRYLWSQIETVRQQNSKCRWFGDRDETISDIRSECNKLMQKEYKTKQGRIG